MSPSYLPIVDQKLPQAHVDSLTRMIASITELYATVACGCSSERAAATLRKLQAEQVSFERNTIWKDLVGQERRAASLHVQVRREF